jgi:hypothetical protein
VTTIFRCALAVVWALCGLLLCAALDTIPDDPAVIKQFTAVRAGSSSVSKPAPVPLDLATPPLPADSVDSHTEPVCVISLATFVPPGFPRRFDAADSSPPFSV